jgi:hypothetical protein
MDEQKVKAVAITIFGFLGIILLFWIGCGDDDSMQTENTWPYAISRAAAVTLGRSCVKEQLKAPSTAEFEFRSESLTFINDSTYTFTGPVDSQNGFGAMIRSNFTVTVEYFPSNDTYRCTDVTIL